MKIQGPTTPGSLYTHLGNAGLSLTPPKKGHTRKTTQCPINFKPEGPLAHQSRDYKKSEEDSANQNEKFQLEEVRVIKEICNQAVFHARALMQTNLPKEQRAELTQAIDPYTLPTIIKGFEELQIGLHPDKDTVQQFVKHFKQGILITIATNLNHFYDKIVAKVKNKSSEPDRLT
jgi:hypothetical protein